MAEKKDPKISKNPGSGRQKTEGHGRRRLKQISDASSEIVKEAASLLDEELAAGILTAKRVQERFQKERRIDPSDFEEALQRFQGDAHEVVTLVNDQFAEMRTQENAEITTRLINNVHDLVDLFVGFVKLGAEVANQFAETKFPKKNDM